ncbi:putative Transcriptional repressor protein KorB [Candidatus Nitrospira nitrosa]|uniref:Putative Transcriptional repressor protein KorB n=1 Tax=Candidatus Nitrospira nitrosa TaxID=1742972 RepID=A0A0S4LNT1_9BACT|nr:ParB/RepB/Spo0J family partition protein [Candidatus Nitrospira nitrosa]CUS38256.1 putative Transcriptional repressor protein KorB [Candidatus Nitrospira nitrosa]
MKKPLIATLDLTALDRTTPAPTPDPIAKERTVTAEVLGRPLHIPLKDIDEDPGQPRQEFDAASMEELEQSVRIHGVKTPISIRPHPTEPKRWILNFGARRLRASRAVGKTTIPAFIDRSHTDYQQVIENLQREDLKPRELAMFIKKKMDEGEKQAHIAELLGVNRSMVTNHLALIDPPACIEEIYTSGKCSSAKTLYDLRNLHKEFPKDVERWCATDQEITRATVSALSAKLRGTQKTPVAPSKSERSGEKQRNSPVPALPSLIVMFQDRSGTVDLRRAPQQANHLIVNFSDGKQEEVPARHCHIEQIIFP